MSPRLGATTVLTVVLLLGSLAGIGAPAGAMKASTTSAHVLPTPVHRGVLRIAGDLADGGMVSAKGVSWRPPHLPAGDTLLSFEVGYYWHACTPGGRCVKAADATATPFASDSYVVGHRDVGKRLRLTETATEVVETDPATFTFRVVRASMHTMSGATVQPYASGRAPATEFVNGTPEPSTASTEEYFQIDPAHYSTANGTPKQHYRVDGRPWRTMPAHHLLYTGKLGVGAHHVAVRTSNRAGATTISFAWQIVPMPQPQPCVPGPSGACWYPPHLDSTGHPMRWDWQIGRVTPLQRTGPRAVDIYDIDGFLTTAADVQQIHTTWQASTLSHPRTFCYLDLAWEDYRPDGSPTVQGGLFPADTLGNIYYGYPQERWVDFRQLDALKAMLDERIQMCAAKGFDAVELDDIDSFDPPSTTGFHLTPGDAQNYLAWIDNEVHLNGMTVLWKNSPLLSWWGRKYTDGAVVEECYIYRECFSSQLAGSRNYGITCTDLSGATPCGWDGFTTDITTNQPTGKWVGEDEYTQDHFVCDPGRVCTGRRSFATFCQTMYAPSYGFAAVKLDVNLDGKTMYPCPNGT